MGIFGLSASGDKKATQSCPCGYWTDERRPCTCTPAQIQRYRSRLSGPLLDRIDLQIEVPAVPYKELKNDHNVLDSKTMRQRIQIARDLQSQRYKEIPFTTNSELSGKWLYKFCQLSEKEHSFLEQAVNKLGLSARAHTRILRIARTIADMEGSEQLNTNHLAEAINYRFLDREDRL